MADDASQYQDDTSFDPEPDPSSEPGILGEPDPSSEPTPTENEDAGLNVYEVQDSLRGGQQQEAPLAQSAPITSATPAIKKAQIKFESSGNSNAIGPKTKYGTAKGLTQLLDSTGEEWHDKLGITDPYNPFDPDQNKKIGGAYLDHLVEKYGDVKLGLAAFNWGLGNLDTLLTKEGATKYDEVAARLPPETQRYVKNIIAEAGGEDTTPTKLTSVQDIAKGVDSTTQGFAQGLRRIINEPEFDGLNLNQKTSRFQEYISARTDWDEGVANIAKVVSTDFIDAAPLDEQPDYARDFGTPPMVEAGEDPNTVLGDWASERTQQLIRQGVRIPLLGDQLDEYIRSATENETDAHAARNRSYLGWGFNRAKNIGQDITKGALQLPADIVAGASRLVRGDDLANTVEELPTSIVDKVMGKPTKDYLYVTDEEGYIKKNDDGSYQTHWQSQAAQTIGNIGASIASLGAGAYAGLGAKSLTALGIGENSLAMANGTFKSVYDDTGNLASAYKATAYTLPAAAVQSIGEVGIVAGLFKPTLKNLNKMSQARLIGLAMTKNAVIGGATGGISDLILQKGETQETAKDFDYTRTGFSALTGAVAQGLIGGVVDSIRANKEFTNRTVGRQSQVAVASKQLADFSNDIASTVITNTSHTDFSPEDLKNLGVAATPRPDGGTSLTKKTNVISNPNVTSNDLPVLIGKLNSLETPNQLVAAAKELAAKSAKADPTPEDVARISELSNMFNTSTRATHLNDIKAIEGQIHTVLQQDPGALPVTYNKATKLWEHVETGKKGDFLAEVLSPEESTTVYDTDVSDTSHISILDEDEVLKTAVTPEVLQAKEEQVNAHAVELEGIKAAYTTQSAALAGFEAANKQVAKASRVKSSLQKSIGTLTQKIEALPKKPTLPEPTTKATERADALRIELEQAKADLAEFSATNWAKLTPQEKKTVKQQAEGKRRNIKKIQAENYKLRQSVRKEARAREEFNTQKKLDETRQELTRRLNSKRLKFEAIRDDVPPGLEAQQTVVKNLSNQLEAARARKKALAEELANTKKGASDFRQLKVKFDNTRKKDLGSITSFVSGKKEIVIPKGLPPAAKEQVMAHEIGHAVSEKITLPPAAVLAMNGRLAELSAKAQVADGRQIASDFMLPQIVGQVTIPEGVLTTASRKALLTQKEFIANQIAAIALKRAGKDIGDFEILPEIESALDATRLPALPSTDNVITPKAPEIVSPPITPNPREAVTTATQDNPPTGRVDPVNEQTTAQVSPEGGDSVPPGNGTHINIFTGKFGETAFSKTVRESVPGLSPDLYEKVSRIRGQVEADTFVNRHGVSGAIEFLESPSSFTIDPRAKVLLIDAIFAKANRDFDATPTAANSEIRYKATQLESYKLTSAAQELALGRRYRNTKDFGDFIATVEKLFQESGNDRPTYTDSQLKELKVAYDQTQGLPDGILRDTYTQKLFERVLTHNRISWPEFFGGYTRTNLVSGAGTQIINAVSGFWTGPIVTGLAHPVLGRGLVWRAMWDVKRVGLANAKRILEGKGGFNLFGGMVNPKPLNINDHTSPARIAASFYNKFGTLVWRSLGAADSFNRTLAAEGYIASESYLALKKKYGNDPQRFAMEVGRISLKSADRKAALAQADTESKALGIQFTTADKHARAYEILRKDSTDAGILSNATDWSFTTSLLGEPANPIQQLARGLFNSHVWDSLPILRAAKTFIQPFGRIMIALSDYTQDFIPGNILFDRGVRKVNSLLSGTPVEPRTKVQQDRLVVGQKVGTTLAALALGLSRSGIFTITGDPEKQLGENKGSPAVTRADFREFDQKGEPALSIIFKNGFTIGYKDIPGVNAIMYGVHQMNKVLDQGTGSPGDLISAGIGFYRGAYRYAVPFLGSTTLNSPLDKLLTDFMAEDTSSKKIQSSLNNFAVSAAKMLTPGSSALKTIKQAYDDTPEESNQELGIKMFKDLAGVSEALGSLPAIDRFGQVVVRPGIEQIPGIGRLVGTTKVPTDTVWKKLYERGITVPELPTTIKFNKSDFSNEAAKTSFNVGREERYGWWLGQAYSNSFSPAENRQFVLATGPHIARVAEQIVDSNLSTARAQELLIKRVRDIEGNAKARFVRTGSFLP